MIDPAKCEYFRVCREPTNTIAQGLTNVFYDQKQPRFCSVDHIASVSTLGSWCFAH